MNNTRKTILTLIAVCLALGYVWYDQRPVIPKKADWDDVRDEATAGGYELITTAKLWQLYKSNPAGLLLVDTRQEWEYRSGHILGAVNFPIEPTWLVRWRKKGELAAVLGANRKRLVVFY